MASSDTAYPPEILTSVFRSLDKRDLLNVTLVNQQWQMVAQSLIYNSIELIDEPSTMVNKTATSTVEITPVHGSTRMKLLLRSLEANKDLCRHVRTITHRCYERPPDPFSDDDQRHLGNESEIESCIPILRTVVPLFINCTTLYLIFPHDSIVKELLRLLLFAKSLDRLWIEAIYIGAAREILEEVAANSGSCRLRSVRLRRILTSLAGQGTSTQAVGEPDVIEPGDAANNTTNNPPQADDGDAEMGEGEDDDEEGEDEEDNDDNGEEDDNDDDDDSDDGQSGPEDDQDSEQEEEETPIDEDEEEGEPTDPNLEDGNGVKRTTSSIAPFKNIIKYSSASLVNLIIDWLLPPHIRNFLPELLHEGITFPCLKTFQVRHPYIKQPTGLKVPITHPTIVSFLLRHPNIVSFGWPAEWFCETQGNAEWERFLPILENMSRNVVFFRTDVPINKYGEVPTVHYQSINEAGRIKYKSRQRAIQFVSSLPLLETLKVEGSMPRDEAAAMIKAAKNSRVKKIVLIGISWPFELLKPIVENGIGSNVEELKFCGFGGAALLNTGDWWKTRTTQAFVNYIEESDREFGTLAQYLSQVPKLRVLTISLNLPTSSNVNVNPTGLPNSDLLTNFWHKCNGSPVDEDVLSSSPEELRKILETDLTPQKLAEDCLASFKKNLPQSFEMLRVLFLMEKDAGQSGEIWDFEINTEWIEEEDDGSGDRTHRCVVKYFVGPRPESHPRRMQEKLDRRKYF